MNFANVISEGTATAGSLVAAVSGGLAVVLLIAGALFIGTFLRGRGVGIAMLLAFYPAQILYFSFPFSLSAIGSASLGGPIVYFVLWAASSWIINQAVGAYYTTSGVRRTLESAIVSGAGTAFALVLLVLHLHVIAPETLPVLLTSFVSTDTLFWWSLMPLMGVFFISRR